MTLTDRYGRVHRDLRISLTDHCNLRCTYCLPAEGVPWIARTELLSTDELVRVVAVAARLGVEEVRLTGGEPLLRGDLLDVVTRVAAIPGPKGPLDVSMTTNGVGLARIAHRLAEAGLRRVNVSLDTLDAATYERITRRDRLAETLAGLAAADDAGLRPVKMNAVLLRGVNDHEAPALLEFALAHGYQLRFIEQMPLDAGHVWRRDGMVTAAETYERLAERHTLTALPGRGAAPAELYAVDGGPGTVGIIASVTRPFCGACDRIRLTADGQLRACLFSREESDLRAILRAGGDDEALAAALASCLAAKLPGHGIDEPGFLQPDRPMSAIGG